MEITYTETEKKLMSLIPNLCDIAPHEIEDLASSYDNDNISELYARVELGRDGSSDKRTYTLHVSYREPQFDSWKYEKLK